MLYIYILINKFKIMKKNYNLFLILVLCCFQMNAQTPCSQDNAAPITNIIYVNPERDNQNVAFDLVVDAYTEFSLTTITVSMATANLALLNPTGIISLYSDLGGLPDALLTSETITPTVVTEAPISTFAIYTVTFTFSTPAVLDNLAGATEATYWVGFNMGNLDNGDTGVTGGDIVAGQPYAVISDNTGGWELADPGDLDGTYTFEGSCLLLGVDEFTLNAISISPNPATDFINIELPSSNTTFSSEIYSITGQLVLKSNESRLDISNLNSGIYMLRVQTDNGVASRRIIKN